MRREKRILIGKFLGFKQHKCGFFVYRARHEVIHHRHRVIVRDGAYHNIMLLARIGFRTVCPHEPQPFRTRTFESLEAHALGAIDVEFVKRDGWASRLATPCLQNRPSLGLLEARGRVEAGSEIERAVRDDYLRVGNLYIAPMVQNHDATTILAPSSWCRILT